MMKNSNLKSLPERQRGAALIVALIMLLLLTMIGVAGMRDNQLQEKMTGSTEDRALAFQAAEAALRAGESQISTTTGLYTGNCSDGTCYYNWWSAPTSAMTRTCTSGAACTETYYWTKYYPWSTSSKSTVYSGSTLTQVASQPLYVIELLPQSYSAISGSQNAGNTSGKMVRDYLITARGTGRTSDAVVVLQSLYRTQANN